MELATLPLQGCFPPTRYQGSKRKLVSQIVACLEGFAFDTVLDAFGGTGAIAHALKCLGKAVTYNDYLRFNQQIGLALVENDTVQLTAAEIDSIGVRRAGVAYGDFIERTFEDIYFTDEENRWLDTAVGNIRSVTCKYRRALCWYALFQSALAKRPYNLFHRKNLYMRTSDVPRSFGNKSTWDRAFDGHFRSFAAGANAAVVDSGGRCRAICHDVLELPGHYDLVYIDPPYINQSGVGVDYRHFYHFLEGMVNYDGWPAEVDPRSKHKRLSPRRNPWCAAESARACFGELFYRYRDSVIAFSYRDDGALPVSYFLHLLRALKSKVEVCELAQYQYVLSTNRCSREVLIVAS